MAGYLVAFVTSTILAMNLVPTDGFMATHSPELSLIGNFTILFKTIETLDNVTICNYLVNIVSTAGLGSPICTTLYKKSGSAKSSVDFKYKLIFTTVSTADRQRVLNLASSAIAKNTSDISTFVFNQSSMTFEGGYGNCSSSSCFYPYTNTICISVIGGSQCVCFAGYVIMGTSRSCTNGYVQRYCNSTRRTIPVSDICDKYQDCPDDSDEINCVCNFTYQYSCKSGRCIYSDWLCDGVKDCPHGDDEMSPQCADCHPSLFQCKRSRACISSALRCDGKPDCDDSSDESQCVSLVGTGTPLLTVTYKGANGWKVCSDNWNQTWSDRVCNSMGFGTAFPSYYYPLSNAAYLSLNSGNPYTNFIASLTTGKYCVCQKAVSFACQPAECGIRKVSGSSVGQYILNGQMAQRGAWPWQVFINIGIFSGKSQFSEPRCGGILLNNRWILTAAHCVYQNEPYPRLGYIGQIYARNIEILLGTISRNNNSDMMVAYADQVYNHSLFINTQDEINNDIGLIRLSQPVSFSDTVRPICLPDKNQDLRRFKVFVNTGFGTTLRNRGSDDLLQARMNIRSDTECSQASSLYRSNTQICVGTAPTEGDINICYGDSGGPLAGQDPNGVWMAIGVNSYVWPGGTSYDSKVRCQRSFVTRVSAFVDWINKTISANSN